MQTEVSRYLVRLAETEADRRAAERLRYRVFVEEMGAAASAEMRAAEREWDDFDPFFDHLLLGAPRPAWMDVPVPYLERGKRDLKAVFGK